MIKTLICYMEPRYWEDAVVNGADEDNDNPTIPLRNGDNWIITIDAEIGRIANWPEGTTARVHYKVCDAGQYIATTNEGRRGILDGYVPSFLSPNANGYGDYVILDIDRDGFIKNWKTPTRDDLQDCEW